MTRVLLHSPFIVDGTSFYRSYGPFSKLRNVEIDLAPKGYLDWTHLNKVDVCFFQRPATPFEIINIEICKNYQKPVWVDYDDYSLNLQNDTNPAIEEYSKQSVQAATREALRLADVVTVSTEELKMALLSHVPTANIKVVSNSIDDSLFSFEPSNHPREKTILMRGGGSHYYDWLMYKDAILETLNEHPDYTLSMMGYHPEWASEVPRGKFYKFSDIPSYFSTLMEIRPSIMIVPLVDNYFNRCKSSIAWMEGTMAGAAVIASGLPEFHQEGVHTFTNPESLKAQLNILINNPWVIDTCYNLSLAHVPKLSDINELRLDILEELVNSAKKYSPKLPSNKISTAQEFHEYALSHGHTQEDTQYAKAHSEAMEWLVNNLRPKTALELGVGTGQSLIELAKRGVVAYGLEYNPYNYEYIKEHHPVFANQVKLGDITTEPIEIDEKGDLVLMIEVAEHIDKSDEWWVNFLTDLSTKFKHFYFSSTPYSDKPSFDTYWGHIAIRRTKHWIELFEKSGWKFEKNPKLLTGWDLIFKSQN